MSITADFSNIVQISNGKTLSISTVKYGEVPSIKNVGTANDIKLEITIPPSDKDLDIEIGNIETGDEPSVKKRVENGKIYLDFVLPTKGAQGDIGPQGATATIEIGEVSIGNVAKVENVGTKNKAILNFTLPYASGQGSYIPNNSTSISEGGSSGGDKETAEELKNVATGINRSAKATEELGTTVADILTQVAAMVNQNKTIIARVVNQSEQVMSTLGDRIDANKMSIKAIQMSTIDKAMLDETKDRMSACEQTVSLLRGELRQIFASDTYRTDKKEVEDEIEKLQESIDSINSILKQLDDINNSIASLSGDSTQSKANIELLQASISELSAEIAGKQDAGQLVTTNNLDANLKNAIESISAVRVTSNQNTKKISEVKNDVNNLSETLQGVNKTILDVQASYAAGDKTNKDLIDALSTKVSGQAKAVNDTIAEIQEIQAAAESKYAHADKVYTKAEIDESFRAFIDKSGGTVDGNIVVNGSVTARTFIGRLNGKADSATVSENATNDGNGNNIAETYVTKTEYNTLSSKLKDTGDRAEQAVTQLETLTSNVEGRISNNADEINSIKSSQESIISQVEALSNSKASNADITELRGIIDDDRANNNTAHNTFENKLKNYMLKSDLITEGQLDVSVAEKLNAANNNTTDIGILKSAREDIENRVATNIDNIAAIDLGLSGLNDRVEELSSSVLTPGQLPMTAIEAMFEEFEPNETAEEVPEEPVGEYAGWADETIWADVDPEEESEVPEEELENPETPENPEENPEEEPTEDPEENPENPAEEPTEEPTEPSTEEPAEDPENPTSEEPTKPAENPEEPESPEGGV